MPVTRTRSLVTAALLAALLAASAWVSVPVGPVPITLQTFIVVIIALVCAPGQAAAAVGLYLLLGAAGIPVFSGARAGVAVLTGPTGGYLIGFLLAAVAGAWIARRPGLPRAAAEMAAAFVVLNLAYVPGTLWLAVATGRTIAEAAAVGVLPFIGFDIAKAAGAIAAVRALARAGVLASLERPKRVA
ncbi:MAG: biotin transporter BioY [Coriobacteriia bacterium]|nr:biotin transporter BioY [Coriobacteriia bacterium]